MPHIKVTLEVEYHLHDEKVRHLAADLERRLHHFIEDGCLSGATSAEVAFYNLSVDFSENNDVE